MDVKDCDNCCWLGYEKNYPDLYHNCFLTKLVKCEYCQKHAIEKHFENKKKNENYYLGWFDVILYFFII